MTQRVSSFRPEPPIYGNFGRPRRPRGRLFGWFIFVGLMVLLFWLFQGNGGSRQTISLSEFRAQLLAHNISGVNIDADELTGQMTGQAGAAVAFRTQLPAGTSANWAFTQWLLENAGPAKIEVRNGSSTLQSILLPLLPWILIFLGIWFFVFRKLRKLREGPSIFARQYPMGSAAAGWVNAESQTGGPMPASPPPTDPGNDAGGR